MAKVRRVDTEIVTRYLELSRQIPAIIKAYGLTEIHIWSKVLGMTKITWVRRKRAGVFTPEELLKICNYINNE